MLLRTHRLPWKRRLLNEFAGKGERKRDRVQIVASTIQTPSPHPLDCQEKAEAEFPNASYECYRCLQPLVPYIHNMLLCLYFLSPRVPHNGMSKYILNIDIICKKEKFSAVLSHSISKEEGTHSHYPIWATALWKPILTSILPSRMIFVPQTKILPHWCCARRLKCNIQISTVHLY